MNGLIWLGVFVLVLYFTGIIMMQRRGKKNMSKTLRNIAYVFCGSCGLKITDETFNYCPRCGKKK